MDYDNNGHISLESFLDIIEIKTIIPEIEDDSNTYWNIFRDFAVNKLKFDEIAHSTFYSLGILIIVFANTICIIIYASIDISNPNNE